MVGRDDGAEALAGLIGLPPGTSPDVARAAAADPMFAHHLAACRDAPELLAVLLRTAPLPAPVETPAAPAEPPARHGLLPALLDWARDGFQTVDRQTYDHRLAACGTCPNLADAPPTVAHRLVGLAGGPLHGKVCAVCGCLVTQKARLGVETCPVQADGAPNGAPLNRWGEPHAPAAQGRA